MRANTGARIWACACPPVAWEAGRNREEGDVSHRFWGRQDQAQLPSHRWLERPRPTVSPSAAEAESQDPDSTNHLESEAPRDYFLKCKQAPGLPTLLTLGLPCAAGLGLGT